MHRLIRPRVIVCLAWIGGIVPTALAKPCEQLHVQSRATLFGVVVERTLPGPPNYESTSRGDKAEIHRFLRLANKKCIEIVEDGRFVSTNLVQLHFVDLKQSQIEKSLRGYPIRVVGEAFAAASGHHHTPLLLTVESVEPASCQELHSCGNHSATPNPSTGTSR